MQLSYRFENVGELYLVPHGKESNGVLIPMNLFPLAAKLLSHEHEGNP